MEIIYNAAIKMPEVDANTVLTDLANYRSKSILFSKKFLWQAVSSISPVAWWKGFCTSTELAKVAVRFLELPTTSAACERTFSTYGGMHNTKRNRLTNDRAGKLVYIAQNLKLLKETATEKSIAKDTGHDVDQLDPNPPSCTGLSELNKSVPDTAEPKGIICPDPDECETRDSDISSNTTTDTTLSLSTDLDSSEEEFFEEEDD